MIAVLAACGGGGSSGTVAPSSVPTAVVTAAATSTPLPSNEARAAFSITLPSTKTASARNRQTIGTGTTSITFTLLQPAGGTAQSFPLDGSQTYCTSGQNGLTCTLSVVAPIGLDVFLAQTYDSNNNLTGSGAVQFDVTENSTNVESLSLTSQVQSVYLTSSSNYLGLYSDGFQYESQEAIARPPAAIRRPAQTGGPVPSMSVFVIAQDSANNTILNPSIFNLPITIQIVYTDIYLDALSSPVADVALGVKPTSYDPSTCGTQGSSTPSPTYSDVQVCSPGDAITATVVNNSGGAAGMVLIGSVNGAANLVQPSPIPSSTPVGAGVLEIPVTVSVPTGSVNVIGQ